MKILLFSTCVCDESAKQKIRKLRSGLINSKIDFTHYFLFQRAGTISEKEKQDLVDYFNENDSLLFIDNMISLSKARNMLIESYMSDNRSDNFDLVAFPDDDAWYNDGTHNILLHAHSKKIDFLFCRYGTKIDKFDASLIKDAKFGYAAVSNLSSNTIFLSHKIFCKNSLFDEELGVGAKYNGGEDLDYGLRCLSHAEKPMYTNQVLVGHRDKNSSISPDYFLGSLIALKKNKNLSHLVFFQFIRKLAIGLYYVLRGKIGATSVFKAIYNNG